MKLNRPIGSVVCLMLLFICSATFASEHNEIASKMMQTQNCSFNISRHNVSYDNVEALRAQQLETIRAIQKITEDSAAKLIQDCPNFETLVLTLRSGIRFGGGFYTPDEDIQLGTGPLNYRKSILTTGDVLARFGRALNKMAKKFQMQAGANVQIPEWNKIMDSVDKLVRMFRRQMPIAFTVMHAFLDINFQNRESFRDSIQQLKRLSDGLIELASQWEKQLVKQKQACELYLKNTFESPVVKISNTRYMDHLALELEDFGEKALSFWKKMNNSNELRNQIAAFAKLPKSTEKVDQYSKMLNYLSSATLDMLDNMKSESSPTLIYDEDNFLYYSNKVKNTLNALLERHLSEHDKQLANIVVKISHHSSTQFNRTSDVPQLLLVAKLLESRIHSKFVFQQYDPVVVALKQLVFPYAHHVLEDVDFNRNSTDIEYLVKNAVASLDTMRRRIPVRKNNAFNHGFHSDYPCILAPFYVWSNAGNALHKLLSGQSVTLKADIRNSDLEMDAIKFQNISFNFKAKNPALQSEIDRQLNWFGISFTHTGDSYYRYQGKYYMMKHEPLQYFYSFAKNEDGTPDDRNGPFEALQKGSTLISSPYTNWKIQLVRMDRILNVSFEKLATFKDQVYLELVGRGQYIESALNDDMHLEKYYTEYYPDDDDDDISAQSIEQRQQSLQLMKRDCNPRTE